MSPSPLTAVPCGAPPPELGNLVGVKLGNYRLERLLGRGRMGVVYLATDEALLRPTAVKVLSWSVADAGGHDPVQWFLAEARIVARINHPRVVQIYGAARHGDLCYLAMEYVPGPSAETAVAAGRPMAPALATDVLVQATSALRAAHGSGVVHRDVKPANLLLGEGGVTKLGDFGMALGPAGVRTGHAHLRVGTPYYTAPEIWRGEAATPASDLYSLAATYFHLLTGSPPYPGADVAAVERGHLLGAPPDPRDLVPGLPASCAALVRRGLAKAPRERHASAQELLWEATGVLRELASGPAPARSPRPAEPAPPPAPAPATDLPAATGPLAHVLGFARRPFCDVDPATHPQLREPLAAARGRILAALHDEAACAVAVTGAPGSGAAALCRHLAAELGRSRLVVRLAPDDPAGGRTLLQRLCGAVGAVGAADGEDLEALAARLGEERARVGAAPVVVLEGVLAPGASCREVASLARAAAWTRSFQLLLRGPAGLAAELAAAGLDPLPEIAVAPLDAGQVSRHVRAWLSSALAPDAPPILVTPDALRLVAARSAGALERVDCIAANMLSLAAAEGSRTLSTWHAWSAPERERWPEAGLPASLPRRPERWPPPEVADVIDACRRAAGVPPWPRARNPQD